MSLIFLYKKNSQYLHKIVAINQYKRTICRQLYLVLWGLDSIEINTSKNWCMPFWAASTRYSLVKGERIVRFVLTAWLHMLFLLVIATYKQSSFHFGVDLLIDVGLFPCVQKWVKQAMKQTSTWTPFPWLMEFVHTVIILEELESLLIQRYKEWCIIMSVSATLHNNYLFGKSIFYLLHFLSTPSNNHLLKWCS